MGIQSRDYFRDNSRRWRDEWTVSGCKWLIAINVVVFVLQLVLTQTEWVDYRDDQIPVQVSVITKAFELSPSKLLHGEVWRPVTYAFCHATGSLFHILFNMLFLYWFWTTLEQMYGTREFILFYLAGAVVSGMAFVLLALVLGNPTPAIGASGAVMAVLAVYAVHFPRQEISIFGIINIQMRYFVLLYLIYDLFPVLQALGGLGGSDGVAHSAHLGGLAFGYLYYRFGLRLEPMLGGLKGFRVPRVRMRSKSVRLYRPPPSVDEEQKLSARVDAILEKIQAQGEASLTDQERDVLRTASQRYKENQRNR